VGQIDEDVDPKNDPSNFYDKLPAPFSFVNKCLEDLIIKNAMEKIL
jgi:hypothetical protein